MVKRVITIRQMDFKDCGPCSLQSIIRYYGGYVGLEKIREDCYTGLNGTSVYNLVEAAKNYGFDALAKKCEDDISNVMLPAIVHVHLKNGLDHFMCLYEIRNDELILMDPASGKIKMHKNVFMKIFSGVVIELNPNQKITYIEKNTTIKEFVMKIVLDNKSIFLWLFISSILFTIFTITSSFYFKIMYEMILENADKYILKYIVYTFLVIALLKIMVNYYKSYYENILTKNIDVNVLSNFLAHVYNLPLKVLNTRKTGEIMSRINELSGIKDLLTSLVVCVVVDLFLIISSLIVLLAINYRLMIILLLIMLGYILIALLINSYLFKKIRNNISLHTVFNTTTIEHINMIQSLKNLNNTDFAHKRSEKYLSNYLYDNYKLKQVLNVLGIIYNFIEEIGVFIINTIGFYYVYKKMLSIGDLILFNNVMVYFINPIKEIISYFPKLSFFKASFRKVCEFTDIEEEHLGKNEAFINGEVIFNNVSFSYNGDVNSVDNFNLKIKKGEKIVIKGKSGSGKSTICKLLNRIYNPDKGEILIAQKNILDYNLRTVRNNIIYVGQQENLYSDTIKNNICIGKDNENFDKICDICLISDIVKNKKFRYDAGIDNSNISGGEKQRIILARALLNDFNILILDEALSELDMYKEQRIIKNIMNYYPDKTIIYVSHKNQDKLFDRVITMREVKNV